MNLSEAITTYGNLRLGAIPDYVASGHLSLSGPAPAGNTSLENLRVPQAGTGFQTAGTSDQTHGYIHLDWGPTPPIAPWVTSFGFTHELSPQASIRVRAFGDTDPALLADMVCLPTSQVGISGAASGVFADIQHGVDAATSAGVTLPPGEWIQVEVAEPPSAPLEAEEASQVRLRMRSATAGTYQVPVTVEIDRADGPMVSVSCHATRMTDGGAIYHAPFDPASVPGAMPLRVKVIVDAAAQVAAVVEEADVVHERPGALYRSGWEHLPALSETQRRVGEIRRPRWPTTYAHHLLESDLLAVAGSRRWEIRLRDGANPVGALYIGTLLAGGHWGGPDDLPLSEDPDFEYIGAFETVEQGAEIRVRPEGVRRLVQLRFRKYAANDAELEEIEGDMSALLGQTYGDAQPFLVSVFPGTGSQHVKSMVCRIDPASKPAYQLFTTPSPRYAEAAVELREV